ncbi:MAG: hypothetical protein ACRDJM_04050, partial [Actinomycetota bacterium]
MSGLEIFDDPAAFRRRVEPFLLAHEAENNLLFGILSQVQSGRYTDHVLAALVSDGGGVRAAALMTPPYNAILSLAPPEAMAELATSLHAAGIRPPGVNGEIAQAEAFAGRWRELTR